MIFLIIEKNFYLINIKITFFILFIEMKSQKDEHIIKNNINFDKILL